MAGRRPTDWPFVPGEIEIGVSQNSDATEPDGVRVRVEDRASHLIVCDAELSYLQLMDCVRGRRGPCTYRINRSEQVGKRHEVKYELLDVPERLTRRTWAERESPEGVAAFLALYKQFEPWCRDGWIPDYEDVFNNHNRREGPGNLYRVTFHRYVEEP